MEFVQKILKKSRLPINMLSIHSESFEDFLISFLIKYLKIIKLKYYNIPKKKEVNNNNLYWCIESKRTQNFGDSISPYIFEKLTDRQPQYIIPDNNDKQTVFVAVGSIMAGIKNNCIIWGTGIMSRDDYFQRPYKVYAVRGPVTRKRFLELGYSCPENYGDPALLLPNIYYPDIKKKYSLGIIPHFVDLDIVKKQYATNENTLIIDVFQHVEDMIDLILCCKRILSSSLHGCIVSHAYGIPATWVQFSDNILGDGTKFLDYFMSVGIDIKSPINLKGRLFEENQLISFVESAPQPRFNLDNIANKLLNNFPFK